MLPFFFCRRLYTHNMYQDKHTHIFCSLRIFLIGYSRNEYFFRKNWRWEDKRTELEGDFLLCALNYLLNFVQLTWFKYSENKCKLIRGQWVWKDWEWAAKEVRWKQGLFSKPKEWSVWRELSVLCNIAETSIKYS